MELTKIKAADRQAVRIPINSPTICRADGPPRQPHAALIVADEGRQKTPAAGRNGQAPDGSRPVGGERLPLTECLAELYPRRSRSWPKRGPRLRVDGPARVGDGVHDPSRHENFAPRSPLPCSWPAPAAPVCPERRRILHRQDHHAVDRLHAGRRLRPLRPAGRPPSRPTHSGQAQHHRAEHARRRQHAGGAAPLFGRAQGRHGPCNVRPSDGHHAAAQSGGAIRRHQVQLARQRDQRSLHLRHLEHLAGEGVGPIS